MPEVNIVKTPVTMAEIERELGVVWHDVRGEVLPPEIGALILALIDLEVGTGRATRNWNLGQIIATRPETQDYYMAMDSGNLRRFRSWPTLRAGVTAIVKQLLSETRPKWRDGLLTGNPDEFVAALGGKHGGPKYFEAPFERYRETFLGRWKRYAPGQATAPSAAPKSGATGSGGGAAGGLLLSFLMLVGLGVLAYVR